MKYLFPVVVLGLLLLTFGCHTASDSQTQYASGDSLATAPPAPEWARNATIYEVNLGQFSAQGNLRAVEAQLARLRELGIDIVWLMPIQPSGDTTQPQEPRNLYTVSNYRTIRPEYGTMVDFRSLVSRAHKLGMRVILDWTPSHTSRNHPWVTEHPDWYVQEKGKITAPIDPATHKPLNWPDAAGLNYANPELRKAMIETMNYWVREGDIDGYRCALAGYVPNDFWAALHPSLNAIKPVFMLAEWEDDPQQFKSGFNMNYGWTTYTRMKAIASGTRPATTLDSLRETNDSRYPAWYYQMLFTQNHDINVQTSTVEETFGPGTDVFQVLCCTLEGMPLIYNGMESNLNKRLSMSARDTISWGSYAKSDFFRTLLTLKHRNRALWNGIAGGKVEKIDTDQNQTIYAFHRQRDEDHVVVLTNLSSRAQTFRLQGTGYAGMYTDIFSHEQQDINPQMVITLQPWEYRVLTN